jgi:hypothetical protein
MVNVTACPNEGLSLLGGPQGAMQAGPLCTVSFRIPIN